MTLHKRVFVLLAVCVLLTSSAFARELPNVDAFGASRTRGADAAALARKAGHLMKRGSALHAEPRLGVPTLIWADGAPASVSLRPPTANGEVPAIAAAREHIERYAPLWGLQTQDVSGASVANLHDTGSGAVIVKFQQQIGGIEIYREELNVLMNRDLEIVAFGGYISSRTTPAAHGSLAFTVNARNAAATAVQDLVSINTTGSQMTLVGNRGGYDYYALPSASIINLDEVRVKKVYYHLPEGLEPAYYIEVLANVPNELAVDDSTTLEGYAYVISANDGSLLSRHNLSNDAQEHKVRAKVGTNAAPLAPGGYAYRVWADPVTGIPYDTPAGNAVHPHTTGVPDGSQFPFLAQQDVTLPNFPFSMNDPWLPPGSTETVGNNVDAFANLVNPDGYGPVMNPPGDPATGDFRSIATASGQFLHSHTAGTEPKTAEARQSTVQQLFYNINFLHDWFYDSGFNETSRNAQASNYGRGGLENDVMAAQAQDVQSRNNANMLTPADGSKPRMRMYLFDTNATKYLDVLSPAAAAGQRSVGTGQFGPQSFDVTNEIVAANPIAGCTAGAYAGVAGKFVLVNRDPASGAGFCSIGTKLNHAMTAGAAGFILVNSQSTPTQAVNVTGSLPTFTIPFLSISWNNAASIKTELAVPNVVTGRMRRDAGLDRDGTIDTQIVFHEWGHYLTNRLIGNSGGLITNHSRGMGEGWSDFTALLLTARADDVLNPTNTNFDGAYAIATYATSGGENNGYYFGIRRTPYSTDMVNKNALTFHHIMDGVPLPVGPPILGGGLNSQVHNTGEVWSTMLWECYASLLRDTLGATPRLTFDQAQERMKQYLVASLKMTPVAPTFLEARDAVLAAAYATDYTDYVLFQQAFAKRGAGINAVAPDRWSTNNAGIVQSFSTAPEIAFEGATLIDSVGACDNDGILDSGEIGQLTVTLENVGTQTLTGTTATVTALTAGVTFPNGNAISFPAVDSLGTTTSSVVVAYASGIAGLQALDFQIDFTDPQVSGMRTKTVSLRANGNAIPASSATDTVEASSTVWSTSSVPPVGVDSAGRFFILGIASPFRQREVTALDHHWFGANEPAGTDERLTSPVFTVDGGGSVNLQFDHSWGFEFDGGGNYDGGVVEMSVNGGAWTDAGTGAYNGTLVTYAGNVNALQGRPAFVANSPGVVHTSLTHPVAPGSTVQFRFRLGSDGALGAAGWTIDNIAFTGVVETPFTTVVVDPGCTLATTTALAASMNPSPYGSSLTLTATVTAGGPAPTGTVTFLEGATTLGTGSLSGGVATFNTSSLSVGVHSLTARFEGAPGYAMSTSAPLTVTIGKAATSLAIGSSVNPSNIGGSVTFTATVSALTGTPTGSVTFFDGAAPLGSVALVSGVAQYTTSALTGGSHTIVATYGGTATYNASTNSVLQTVTTGSTIAFNPAAYWKLEDAGMVTLTVTRTGGDTSGVATVAFATANGTATAGVRYTASNSILQFNGGETSKTIDITLLDTVAIEGQQSFTVTLSSPNAAVLGTSVATVNVMDDDTAESDFSSPSNGTVDIVWRNETTGDTRAWAMNGTTFQTSTNLLQFGGNWRLAAVADFNADGKADILYRNASDFSMVIWYMNGTSLTSTASVQAVPDAAWQIVTAGDMNRDGFPDIVWRNSNTFAMIVWLMRDNTLLSIASLPTVPDANWQMKGLGDFNRDGIQDMVWRNQSSFTTAVWLMSGAGTTFGSAVALPTVGHPWNLVGVGDMNADGDSDLIWRASTNNNVAVWLMNQTAFSSATPIPTINDAAWQIVSPR